jgi:YHS domain-containing protein
MMEGLGSLLLFALMFYLMMRFGCGAHMIHGHGGHAAHHGGGETPGSQKDPVCGMEVAEGSGYVKMHEGGSLRFCSRQCLDKFEQNPAAYLSQSGVTR